MSTRMVGAYAAVGASGGALAALSAGWQLTGGLLAIVVAALLVGTRRESGADDAVDRLVVAAATYLVLALVAGGVAVHAIRFEDAGHPELAGAAALGAVAVMSYMRPRVEASLGSVARDVGRRLLPLSDPGFLLAVLGTGSLLDVGPGALWICAALAALTVGGRLTVLRLTGTGVP